jgi:hypothetical protein
VVLCRDFKKMIKMPLNHKVRYYGRDFSYS